MAEELDGTEKEYDLYPDAKCSICGSHPTAMWRGVSDVFICPGCAVDVLPRLIADALTPDDAQYGKILDDLEAMKTPYLTAALCRVAHKRQA
jgi:hypothetical protein